jgi:hypothetical protein
LERIISQHFGCNNGRKLQTFIAKHVQSVITVFNKHREKSIIHQVCQNKTSIIIIIASKACERAIFQHTACNGRESETLIAWHVHRDFIASKGFHMFNII